MFLQRNGFPFFEEFPLALKNMNLMCGTVLKDRHQHLAIVEVSSSASHENFQKSLSRGLGASEY